MEDIHHPLNASAVIAVMAAGLLFVSSMISFLDFAYLLLASMALMIGLVAILLLRTKKMPSGSKGTDWEQSGVRETTYPWSDVSSASIENSLRGSAKLLYMTMGSSIKNRRSPVLPIDQ